MAVNVKKWEDYYADEKAAKKQSVSAQYDTQLQTINDTYGTKIRETETEYEEDYRANAVQKLINEREVAENMANLGLTDSGLNRTQQTAVQLSYANNKAKLDRQKQSMVDSLRLQLADKTSEVETNRYNALMQIDDDYSQRATSAALTEYETEQKYIAEVEKERIEAEKEAEKKASYIIQTNGGLLSRNFTGSLADNNVSVYQNADGNFVYVDNNSGKTTTLLAGTNPYTGDYNHDVYAYEAENYGFYKNGYQPKGIKGHGKIIKSVGTDVMNGNTQNVWQTADGNLWIWDGKQNKYLAYDANGDGVSDIRDYVRIRKN